MTFERSWVLVFLVAVPLFAVWQWRAGRRKLMIALKSLMLACVILALSEPRLQVNETKVAAAVLVDTSASTTEPDLARAREIVGQLEAARGRHEMSVTPFARTPRALSATEVEKGFAPTPGEAGRGTDLEAAVRHAAASLPGGLVPRVVLISDGNETEGNLVRASWMARQIGIPVDTYALAGRPAPLLRVEAASVPAVAFSGEKFPLTLSLSAPRKTDVSIELSAEGKSLGTSPVSLQAGANQIRLHTSLNVTGAVEIGGVVRSKDSGDVTFRQAITLRRPRVLYVSQDPPGTEVHLRKALQAAHFDVQPAAAITPSLTDYQIVVLNNVDLEAIPLAQMQKLEQYV
ncbi:MAG TPA: vWA domain-containing protein, partial [Bryobacteraceae bacterium]|nr:vWA domain-containing protein [Bryobacteraceae bacterium]